MVKVMAGVRVLEVAQFIFVPSAGALLADWGADVIKIEHPVRGDAQRGLARASGIALNPDRNPILEHANRGKRSVGIDVATEEGRELIYMLARRCDVFLTNYLPAIRQKLGIDLEQIRAVNPDIIYVRGSAYGDRGPDRDIGGFDVTAFWMRSGIGNSMTPPGMSVPLTPGIGGFGDSIGGMSIAGGVAAALLHRDRTGEALEVDVSLLSTAGWVSGVALNTASLSGTVMKAPEPKPGSGPYCPLIGNYPTADGATINLFTMQPGPHFRSLMEQIDRRELADDPRFATAELMMQNWQAASAVLLEAFAAHPLNYWRQKLRGYSGQWAPAQSFVDLLGDEQVVANDLLVEVEAIDGGAPMRIAGGPVQFNAAPCATTRSPQPSEHTEAVLVEMGLSWDEIERLKATGAIA